MHKIYVNCFSQSRRVPDLSTPSHLQADEHERTLRPYKKRKLTSGCLQPSVEGMQMLLVLLPVVWMFHGKRGDGSMCLDAVVVADGG